MWNDKPCDFLFHDHPVMTKCGTRNTRTITREIRDSHIHTLAFLYCSSALVTFADNVFPNIKTLKISSPSTTAVTIMGSSKYARIEGVIRYAIQAENMHMLADSITRPKNILLHVPGLII